MPQVNDKIQVKAGGDYWWGRITSINTSTYIMPIFTVILLHGPHSGEKVATPSYLDHAKAGQHIDHAFPAAVNG